jgi:hypothetical protein
LQKLQVAGRRSRVHVDGHGYARRKGWQVTLKIEEIGSGTVSRPRPARTAPRRAPERNRYHHRLAARPLGPIPRRSRHQVAGIGGQTDVDFHGNLKTNFQVIN